MADNDKKLYKTIVEKQGNLLYTTLSEECAELIQACSKIQRKKFFNKDFSEDVDNLLEEILGFETVDNKKYFLYRELLPISLNEKIGYDKYEEFVYTNQELDIKENLNIYKVNSKHIFYF